MLTSKSSDQQQAEKFLNVIELQCDFLGHLQPFSKQNELAAWKMVFNVCEDLIKKFPTSLQEDRDILENETLTPNVRNCIFYRTIEKDILHFMQMCSLWACEILSLTSLEEAKAHMELWEDIDQMDSGFNEYCKNVLFEFMP